MYTKWFNIKKLSVSVFIHGVIFFYVSSLSTIQYFIAAIYKLVWCRGGWLVRLDSPVPSFRFFLGGSWWFSDPSLDIKEVLVFVSDTGDNCGDVSTSTGGIFSAAGCLLLRVSTFLSSSDSSSLVGTRLLDRMTGTVEITGRTRLAWGFRTTFLVCSGVVVCGIGSGLASSLSSLASCCSSSLSSLESIGIYLGKVA